MYCTIYSDIELAPGNPFAHIGKMQRTPCDIYAEMSILTNLTDSYVLESISSRIKTYFGFIFVCETTQRASDVLLERANWHHFLQRLPWGERSCCNEIHDDVIKWKHFLCAGNSPITKEFLSQRSVTRSFGVFFDLCLNKRLRRHSAYHDVIVISFQLAYCNTSSEAGGRLNKKDGLTRYGNSHVKDKTS